MNNPQTDIERLVNCTLTDLYGKRGASNHNSWDNARADLERYLPALLTALTEPSEVMIEAAWSVAFDGGWELSLPQCERVFTAMINHILKEAGE